MISSTNLKLKAQELLKPFAERIGTVGVSPNIVTVAGFVSAVISGIAIAVNNFFVGTFFFVLSGLCDMLDGIIARVNGRSSKFGAFLDSFLDRYSDFFPIAGIAILGFCLKDFNLFILALFSIAGSFATSYARAKAESLNVECKVGILERPERFFLLLMGLISGFLTECLFLLAVLSNVTALQRLLYTAGKLKK